jgi:putative hydrolase of the HAD superfamily
MTISRKGLKRYRVLTFDLIGTLIDFESGILNYMRPVVQASGKSIADPAILEAFGWAEHKQHKADPNASFTAMLTPAYVEMAGVLGLPGDIADVDGLKKSIPKWPAFEDAAASLEALGKRFRLVALTNADNWAYWYMNKTLGEPFDDKVTAEDVGVSKPDAQMFAYCLGRQSAHGFTRHDVLHVAQSQYHDIRTASRLGIATAWIERRKGQSGFGATPEPDSIVTPTYHFTSLGEFVDTIDKAFRQ